MWAWAAVRFGWTPDEFDRLTATQIALLQVAEHDRVASDQMLLNGAIANALANGYKKKSEEPELLWVEANKPDKKTMSAKEARAKMAALEKALSDQQK
nr:MAG TPA: tail assembly chaperone protein [Caudoviricetes sp.]